MLTCDPELQGHEDGHILPGSHAKQRLPRRGRCVEQLRPDARGLLGRSAGLAGFAASVRNLERLASPLLPLLQAGRIQWKRLQSTRKMTYGSWTTPGGESVG
jgi:hypothetical protein